MNKVLALALLSGVLSAGFAGASAQAHEGGPRCKIVSKCKWHHGVRHCKPVKVCRDLRGDHGHDH